MSEWSYMAGSPWSWKKGRLNRLLLVTQYNAHQKSKNNQKFITWNANIKGLVNLGLRISPRIVSETHPHATPRPRSNIVCYSREYSNKNVHCMWPGELCRQCSARPHRLLLKHLQTNIIHILLSTGRDAIKQKK